jgi:signal peptidase I
VGSTAPSARPGAYAAARRHRWLLAPAVLVLVIVVVRAFVVTPFGIPSASMQDTLLVGDRILVSRTTPPAELRRGDIVVFDASDAFNLGVPARGPLQTLVDAALSLVGQGRPTDYVKRVIGLPGDHVVCCDAGGQLTVNGTPLNEKYINPAEIPQVRDFDVVVPAGKVWVMGDNRNHSADSRAHMDTNGGFVNESDIEGKAAVIAWPLNRISALDNYPDVFRAVPAPSGK